MSMILSAIPLTSVNHCARNCSSPKMAETNRAPLQWTIRSESLPLPIRGKRASPTYWTGGFE
jgi:hypothetical protein